MSDTPETDSLLRGDDKRWSVNMVELRDLCRKLERERDKWREKAEHLGIACKVWEDEATLHPLTHCPDCREFRGHGHECKSEPPPARNCRECCGQGQVEIQSGPYMTQCPECNGTGKQTSQPKP